MQPPPIKNDSTPIAELVLVDVSARRELGRARYGTDLQAHNGRDALRDAYEEALDLVLPAPGARGARQMRQTREWRTRSVLPGGQDGGPVVYRFYGGTRESQLEAERLALEERG